MDKYDVIIVGGGIAGLTAGIYTSRAGLKTLILEGEMLSNTQMPGGQLMLTPEIENFPGFTGTGPDLLDKVRSQAEEFGSEIADEMAEELLFLDDVVKIVRTESTVYHTRSIIIATGSVARRLEVPNEDTYFGRGVSVCATCDGAFFKDQEVIVVGGGHVAVEDALYLSRLASKVNVVHRRDELRAKSPESRKLLQAPNVDFHWNSIVEEIHVEDGKVQGVRLQDGASVSGSGVFVAIGHNPESEIAKNILQIDDYGYLITEPGTSKTNVPGVFVAGDVADSMYRQAITAAGSGCMAAIDAQGYLLTREVALSVVERRDLLSSDRKLI